MPPKDMKINVLVLRCSNANIVSIQSAIHTVASYVSKTKEVLLPGKVIVAEIKMVVEDMVAAEADEVAELAVGEAVVKAAVNLGELIRMTRLTSLAPVDLRMYSGIIFSKIKTLIYL